MTAYAINKLLKRVPFEPFRLVTSSGDKYTVKHPENCLLAKEWAVVVRRASVEEPFVDDFDYLSYLHISAAEPLLSRPRKR